MARPGTTRKTQRAQVNQQFDTPALDVVAPLNVNVPGSSGEGWTQLQRAVGVLAPIAGARQKHIEQQSLEQGMADKQLNKVDAARLQKEKRYADGVYRYTVINETNKAFAAVEERAASGELPENLTVQQKVEWYDAELQKELADVASDPEGRRLIAERYQNFIEKVAGREVSENVAANQASAYEAVSADVESSLDGDRFDYDEQNQALTAILGDRSKATAALVDIIASHAERVNDDRVFALIPSTIVTADGQTVAGPRNTPKHRDRIALAQARIEKARREALGPDRAWREAQLRQAIEARVKQGLPLSLTEFEEPIRLGVLTPEYVTSAISRASEAADKENREETLWQSKLGLFKSLHAESWLDTVGVPGGAESSADAQELADRSVREALTGYARAAGLAPALDAAAVAAHGDLLAIVLEESRIQRVPYTPLKSYFSDLTAAQPTALLARLPAYEMAKAAGVEALYVDTDTSALFETALTAKRAGEKPEEITNTLRRAVDPAMLAYVKDNRGAAHKAVMSGEFDVENRWRDANTKGVANLPMVQAQLRALAETYLARGLSPKRAGELAHRRFAATNFTVALNGRTLVIPNSTDYEPAAASAALEWMQGKAKEFAKAQGIPNADEVTLAIDFGITGRGPEVFMQDNAGGRVNARPLSMPALIGAYRKEVSAETYRKAVEAGRRAQTLRREASKPNPLMFETRDPLNF